LPELHVVERREVEAAGLAPTPELARVVLAAVGHGRVDEVR
jgi:hypothetical protein